MPLRRRPSEPSPRLQALLEAAGHRPVGDSAARPVVRPVVRPAEGVGPRTPAPLAGVAGVVEPWLPERSWLVESTPVPRPVPRVVSAPGGPGPAGAGDRPGRGGRHRRPRPPGPRLLTVPDSLRGARLTGPRAAAAGLLIVLVVAAVAFGARVALARAASVPQVVAPAGAGSAVVQGGATGTAFASSTTASGGGGPPTAARVTVHVVGQVAKPGVVELAAGARVADAVARAGGAVKGADLSAVNLARVLTDGEQIRVPRPGEALAPAPGASGVGTGSGPAGAPGGVAGAKVNLNQASGAELEELPGVGPVLAQRIIDWRTEHGRFSSIDELGEVSGIGEKIFAQLAPKVTV